MVSSTDCGGGGSLHAACLSARTRWLESGRNRMTRIIPILCFCAAIAAAQPGRAPVYDVKSYGATGAGKSADTAAINQAIAAANDAGGGTVFFPAGMYLSGS